MDTQSELQEKIKSLKKQIKECTNDAKALLLQKQLIDLLSDSFKNKDNLIKLMTKNKI